MTVLKARINTALYNGDLELTFAKKFGESIDFADR